MSALLSSVENEQKVDGVRALKRWVARTAERLLQSANAEKLQPVECAEESAKTK